jgi:hypothetical protein
VGVAGRLVLPIIDRRICSGIGGATRVNVYMAQVYVPSLPHMLFQAFSGVELEAGGQRHSVLLGRTFLQQFAMQYNGKTGEVVIEELK